MSAGQTAREMDARGNDGRAHPRSVSGCFGSLRPSAALPAARTKTRSYFQGPRDSRLRTMLLALPGPGPRLRQEESNRQGFNAEGFTSRNGPWSSGKLLVFRIWMPALCSPLKGVIPAGHPAARAAC